MAIEEVMNVILIENMSEKAYFLWMELYSKIPYIWDRASSASGKYHKDNNNNVRSIREHTFEMLNVFIKCMDLFSISKKSKECDTFILAILLHDAFKYGINDPLNLEHTVREHDKIVANSILMSKDKFIDIINVQNYILLENMTRFHAGKWSTDAKSISNFKLSNLPLETIILHFIDCLSARNLLNNGDIIENGK